jgi:hypothetical protein
VIGWDYVHIAVDDATRLAYAEVLPDEKATTAIGFLNVSGGRRGTNPSLGRRRSTCRSG